MEKNMYAVGEIQENKCKSALKKYFLLHFLVQYDRLITSIELTGTGEEYRNGSKYIVLYLYSFFLKVYTVKNARMFKRREKNGKKFCSPRIQWEIPGKYDAGLSEGCGDRRL